LREIFSQNKADDAANPLWIGKESNAVMRKNRSKDGCRSCSYMFKQRNAEFTAYPVKNQKVINFHVPRPAASFARQTPHSRGYADFVGMPGACRHGIVKNQRGLEH
jgi:hypothetical protein